MTLWVLGHSMSALVPYLWGVLFFLFLHAVSEDARWVLLFRADHNFTRDEKGTSCHRRMRGDAHPLRSPNCPSMHYPNLGHTACGPWARCIIARRVMLQITEALFLGGFTPKTTMISITRVVVPESSTDLGSGRRPNSKSVPPQLQIR